MTKKKNVTKDAFGNLQGRVHIDKQEVNKLQTRKMKGLKKTPEEKKELRKAKKLAAKVAANGTSEFVEEDMGDE